ncbi:hypothetical protein GCM10022419_007840 [Nonomuraea rosea]|uniref:Restriction endonuclease type IV Mrr domain-containing protein n=1 Tax=Nonomuraea rosea TaxID=638574 RepID=A0ABP6VCP0_9ACTN
MKRDIEEGARLVQELEDRGFPLSAALWAHMEDSDEWLLVIAAPSEVVTSRATAYQLIQDALRDLGLNVPLSRITLVKDEDRTIQNLRALAEAERSRTLGLKFGPASISSQHVTEGYVYLRGPLEYERQVFDALRQMADLGQVLDARGSRLFADAPSRFDFIFSSARKIVLVEVHALTHRLPADHIRDTVAWHSRAAHASPAPVALLVVAKNGFTEAAEECAREFQEILRLITWSGSADISTLRAGITDLLTEEDGVSR